MGVFTLNIAAIVEVAEPPAETVDLWIMEDDPNDGDPCSDKWIIQAYSSTPAWFEFTFTEATNGIVITRQDLVPYTVNGVLDGSIIWNAGVFLYTAYNWSTDHSGQTELNTFRSNIIISIYDAQGGNLVEQREVLVWNTGSPCSS